MKKWTNIHIQNKIDIPETIETLGSYRIKEMSFLRDIIKKRNINIFVEIGLWQGSIIEYMNKALSIKEYWGVDSWKFFPSNDNKTLVTFYNTITKKQWEELSFIAYQKMIKFAAVKIIRLESVMAAKLFPDNYFDMVFIDANHDYEHVCNDITVWFPKIKKGGLISGDDLDRSQVKKAIRTKTKEISNLCNFRSYQRIWIMDKKGK